ncbi:hypothetical protein MYK68_08670 [Gordonia sp. PP30]|uniref:hypothetical protein n=1 Tax=unclassified Gordonia (in: high G+C Gram-positive bacteria) TaxID=2657482 RepID=UPI001FFF281E|nr:MULTISPECIES: hypothetical protein [unclassified Gordonia (in: high G+C Gram-positive bacteria)]UQE76614.1 hypothetical protein MYK68_08670 [Gordonia sp. PP30]
MWDLEASARQRAESEDVLFGSTPAARRKSAQIVVKIDRLEGKEPPRWVLDVAEGRLPA